MVDISHASSVLIWFHYFGTCNIIWVNRGSCRSTSSTCSNSTRFNIGIGIRH